MLPNSLHGKNPPCLNSLFSGRSASCSYWKPVGNFLPLREKCTHASAGWWCLLLLLPRLHCGAASDTPFPGVQGDAKQNHCSFGKTQHHSLNSITDEVLVLTLIFLVLLCIYYKLLNLNFLSIFILSSRPKKYVWIFFNPEYGFKQLLSFSKNLILDLGMSLSEQCESALQKFPFLERKRPLGIFGIKQMTASSCLGHA